MKTYPDFLRHGAEELFAVFAEDLLTANVQYRVCGPRHGFRFFTSKDFPHRLQSTLKPSTGVVESISRHLWEAIWLLKVTYDAARDMNKLCEVLKCVV